MADDMRNSNDTSQTTRLHLQTNGEHNEDDEVRRGQLPVLSRYVEEPLILRHNHDISSGLGNGTLKRA